jgi:uncharacterized protein (TIGR00369 family)
MSSTSLSAEQVQAIFDRSPFISFMKPSVISADLEKQELTVRAPMRAEFERAAGTGQWHGGPIAALIDTIGDFALAMLIGHPLPTLNFRVDYLRRAIQTDLIVVARVRRIGRSVGTADVDITDEKGVLLAIGRATYATASG